MCIASLKVLLTSSDNILSQSSGVRFKSAQWVEKNAANNVNVNSCCQWRNVKLEKNHKELSRYVQDVHCGHLLMGGPSL